MSKPVERQDRIGVALLVGLALATISCGGGSSPTAPRFPDATPTPTSAGVLGGYGTQPCCCGFWTYTLTRGGETTSWSCWGWIEIRSQEGTALVGYTDMEKNATACPDDGKCMNGSQPSTGTLDASGALVWTHGAGDSYSRQVAEKNGCTVVGDSGTMAGTLVGGVLQMTATTNLRCDGATATVTLSGQGLKVY